MRSLRYFSLFILILVNVACGGGGSIEKDNNGDTTENTYVITITGTDPNGEASRTITKDSPLSIAAKLTENGNILPNALISFDAGNTAEVTPNTALTDSNGIAMTGLSVTDIQGAGTLTATYSLGDSTVSSSFTYTSTGGGDSSADNAARSDIKILINCGAQWDDNRNVEPIDPTSFGCTETNSLSSNDQADVYMKVTSADGVELENILVTAATTLGSVLPTSGNAITDKFGVALLKLQPGNAGGAGTLSITSNDLPSLTGSVNFSVGASEVNLSVDNGLTDSNGVSTRLSAGGSTVITVTLTDENAQPLSTPLEVEFSSVCASEGKAEIDQKVTSSNGIAKSTYRAKGCQGEDPITITVLGSSQSINTNTIIEVDSAPAQALQFIAEPTDNSFVNFIALPPGEGGLPTQSVVTFKLIDEDNLPVPRARIDFSLSDDQGRATLTQTSANTNSEGLVSTTVKSGLVPGPLVVQACLIPQEKLNELSGGEDYTCWESRATICNNPATKDAACPTGTLRLLPLSEQILSVSSQLILSSGVTDQDTFDVSSDISNTNSLNYNGIESNVTVYFGDQFNQFNANGVAATVISEAGVIGSKDSDNTYECRTSNASCQVVWRSQGERPFYDTKWGNRIGDTDGDSNTFEGVAPGLAATLTDSQKRDVSNWNCDAYFGSPAPCWEGMLRKKDAVSGEASSTANRRVVMGGRVGILAYVKGQESHRDEAKLGNTNGLFDIGEYRQEFDLTEAFLDTNENNIFDKADCTSNPNDPANPCSPVNTVNGGHDDIWIDANGNGIFDYLQSNGTTFAGDGKYNGLLCSESAQNAGECTRELVNVYARTEIVMSGDQPYFRVAVEKTVTLANGETRTLDSACNDLVNGTTVLLDVEPSGDSNYCDVKAINLSPILVDTDSDGEPDSDQGLARASLVLVYSDEFGNKLPSGTTVSVAVSNGELAENDEARSTIVANSSSTAVDRLAVTVIRESDDNQKTFGVLSISFTFDEGQPNQKDISYGPVNVIDAG